MLEESIEEQERRLQRLKHTSKVRIEAETGAEGKQTRGSAKKHTKNKSSNQELLGKK